MDGSTRGEADPAPTVVRTTLWDALEQAQALQRTEKLVAAETIYTEILEQLPDEPNALNFLGILRHQQGRVDEAVALLRRAIELVPDQAGPWLNLGNVLIENERFDQAADALQRVVALDPGSAAVYNNLGIALLRCGRLEASEQAFLQGLQLEPDRSDVHYNYARMLYLGGRRRESVAHSIRALDLEPTQESSRQLLSLAYFVLGEPDKAIANLLAWRELEPDNPQIDHMLAAVGGAATPQRASDQYVQHVFDGFAASFDHKLELLDYKAPQMVADALRVVIGQLPAVPDIVDAGCGTGLCGPLLKPHAGRLVGVDLSSGMLQRAAGRGVYDQLVQAELTNFLAHAPAGFDVIVSADTLCYFGELTGFFAAAWRALRGRGVAIFSVEAAPDDGPDYRLHVHGRYSHSKRYLLDALQGNGFNAAAVEAKVLRREMDEPVDGWVVTAVRREQGDPLRTWPG